MKTKQRKLIAAAILIVCGALCLGLGAANINGGKAVTAKADSSGVATYAASVTTTASDGLVLAENEDGGYTVTDYTGSSATVTVPDEYDGLPVTEIGEKAFYKNTTITEVSIGKNVKALGDYAFCDCTALKTVDFPDGLEYIGASAFNGCTAMKSITVPRAVTHLGRHAFWCCYAVTSINFNAEALDDLDADAAAFTGAGQSKSGTSLTIGAYVTRIPAYAFDYESSDNKGAAKLTKISFESGCICEEIGEYAFYSCKYITTVNEFPDTLYKIGKWVFEGCTALSSISIPDTVTEMGTGVFDGCSSLTEISLPDSITEIPGYTFYGCESLTGYEFADTVTKIGNYAFWGCSSIEKLVIPGSVEEIGEAAFGGCGYLSDLTIPFVGSKASASSASATTVFGYIFGSTSYTWGVSTAQYYQFANGLPVSGKYKTYYISSKLTSVTVTGGKLLTGAFYGCKNIESISLTGSVSSIGTFAFDGCSHLKSFYLGAEFVESLGSSNYAFYDAGTTYGINVTIGAGATKVPAYLFNPYKAAVAITSSSVSTYASTDPADYAPNIKSVTFEEGSACETIGTYAFAYLSITSVTLPASLTSIENYAFYYCDKLCYVGFEEGGEGVSIGSYAFAHCAALSEVSLCEGLVEIKQDAFYMCEALASIAVPSGTETIGSAVFKSCTALESVTLGSGIKEIGQNAFDGCAKLNCLNVESMTSFVSIDFGDESANPLYVVTLNGGALYVAGVRTTKITEENAWDAEYVGSYALAGCTIITDAAFSENLTHVGKYAFEGMEGLNSLTMAECRGWSAYSSDGTLVSAFSAEELEGNLLEYFTSLYLDCVWERTIYVHAAPTIECVVENFGYTNAAITVTTTVDGECSISRIFYTDPAGDTYTVYDHRLTISDGLMNGLYVFSAVDTDGLESDPYYITYDDGAPEIYATGSDVWGGYVGNGFSVYAKDENDLSPVTLYYSRDGESWVSCGGDSFSVTPSGDSGNDGRYWFAAMDAAGNKVGAYWIVLDTAVPYGEWGFTDDLSLYFSWEAPSYTTWTCTVNGKAYTKGATYRDETTYTAVLTSPTGNMGTVTYRLDHAYEEEYVEATCSQSAYRLYTCVYCGDVVMELDPFSTAGEHTYELTVKEPSCTESGYSEYVCTGCGAATGYSYIAPLGHIGVADSYIEPTCTSDGYTGTVCSRCGEKLSGEPISKLGHDFVVSVTEATCTEPAKKITTCSRCDDYYVEEISGDALGHEYAVTEYEAPDCESAGCRVFVCGTCGDSYTEDLPALGHSTVTTYVKDENGDTWAYEECTRCGEIVSAENLGSVEETASNGVIEIFRKYRQYMWWILLAFVAIWSIFIGLRWALARNSEEKAKSHSMLANYIIGLFVIAVILVGLPYLIYGIAVLVA